MPRITNKRNREIIKRVTYNDLPLSRTTKKSKGFDKRLLDKMERWLSYVVRRYNRAYFVRFDLNFPDREITGKTYPDDNVLFTDFLEVFRRIYIRQKIRTDYFWVRERSKSGVQHYHLFFVFDGNRTQSSHDPEQRVKDIWAMKLEIESNAPVHRHNPEVKKIWRKYVSENHSENWHYQKVYEDLSYLAKVYSKDTPHGINEYGQSRFDRKYISVDPVTGEIF